MSEIAQSPRTMPNDGKVCVDGREQFCAVVADWNAGGEPDTLTALRQFPQLNLEKSVILDLAYEEYVRRLERGEEIDRHEFCARFADFRSSVLKTLEAHDCLSEGLAALEQGPTPWPQPGELLGDYRIRKLLGRGGFACVYLADHVITGKQMVVKIAPANPREPRLLGQLEHPHVVPIHDAREVPGGMCMLVMPYLGNSTLLDLLDVAFSSKSSMPRAGGLVARAARRYRPTEVQVPEPIQRDYVGDILVLATELARGLAYLHGKGIVHRDLKPTNVLLSWAGQPVILDFNLAEGPQDIFRCGAGTLAYMAPEQIEAGLRPDDARHCDRRADLFSYGVILYELLSGRHPFNVPNVPESAPHRSSRTEFAEWLLGQHRRGCLPLRTHRLDIDPAVERLVGKCLSFEPSQRPQSADAIVSELQRIQGRQYRFGRWLRRWQRPVAAAACTAALALGGTTYWLATRPPYAQRVIARAQTSLKNGEPSNSANDLDELLHNDPANSEARFLRGVARVRLNQFDFAAEDFNKVWTETHADKARAMLAYCMAANGSHAGAIYHLEKVNGFPDNAALLNNRAYSALRWLGNRQDAAQVMRIREDLDRCLALNPQLPQAYLNRAEMRYNQWNTRKDLSLLEGAIKDIDRAIELGLVTGQTRYDAALFRMANWDRRPEREAILAHLQEARRLGRDLQRLKHNFMFERFRSDPLFIVLLEPVPATGASQRLPDGLADPLLGPLR